MTKSFYIDHLSGQVAEKKIKKEIDDLAVEIKNESYNNNTKALESKIKDFCLKSHLKFEPATLRKIENYRKKLEIEFTRIKSNIDNVMLAFKKSEDDIRNCMNIVENKINPQISAVEQTLEEYQNNSQQMKEQFETLLNAEKEVQKKIAELNLKKNEQKNKNMEIEELDINLRNLLEFREEKTKEIAKLKQAINEYDAESKNKIEYSKQEIFNTQLKLKNLQEKLEKTNKNLDKNQEKMHQSLKCGLETQSLHAHNINKAHQDLLSDTMQKRILFNNLIAKQNDDEPGCPEVIYLPLKSINPSLKENAYENEYFSKPKMRTTLSSKRSSLLRPTVQYNLKKTSNRSSSRENCNKQKFRYNNTKVTNSSESKVERRNDYQNKMSTKTEQSMRTNSCKRNEMDKECFSFTKTMRNSSKKHSDYCSSKNTSETIRKRYLKNLSASEAELFNLIEPLLKGHEFYKKINSQRQTQAFDALNDQQFPPESCGYEKRFITLSNDMKSLNIQQSVEKSYSIPIKSIEKPIIPQKTIEIIKLQKNAKTQNQLGNTSAYGYEEANSGIFTKISMITTNNSLLNSPTSKENYKKKCVECKYFPFWYKLSDKGKVELIANSYGILKAWVLGISALIKNQRIVEKFRSLADYSS